MAAATVVLLPGLWVHAAFMRVMAARIARRGFRVHRFSYPSMRRTLDENAAALAAFCAGLDAHPLHLVAHSMGGLVVMRMLALSPALPARRAVLIGTPFADSFSARRLARLPGGRALLGRSMPQWLEGPRSGDTACEIGVVAGDLSFGLGRVIAPDLEKPNDGVVSVKETAVPGMRDRVVLHVSHTAMLFSRGVADAACVFLERGSFAGVAGRG